MQKYGLCVFGCSIKYKTDEFFPQILKIVNMFQKRFFSQKKQSCENSQNGSEKNDVFCSEEYRKN